MNDMGNVAETCMGNVAVVDKDGALRSPHYDGSILAGTTLLRAFDFAPQLVQVQYYRLESWSKGSTPRIPVVMTSLGSVLSSPSWVG